MQIHYYHVDNFKQICDTCLETCNNIVITAFLFVYSTCFLSLQLSYLPSILPNIRNDTKTTWQSSSKFEGPLYGGKLSQLAREHFDKFTSEIYKVIWKVTLQSYETKDFPVYPKISLVDWRDFGTRESVCPQRNFLQNNTLHFTKSTSQQETLPGKRDNVFHVNLTKSFG